jgi:predicted MFS family arabinose efflux permease
VLLSAWLITLLVAASESPLWGWASPQVVVLLVATAVLAPAWLGAERRAVTPLIDLDLMRRRPVWTNNLVALLVGVAMYGVFAFLPQFVETPASSGYGFGASVTQSGLILLPSTVTMFAVGIYSGPLARRIGGKLVVAVGSAISLISLVMLTFAHAQEWQIYVAVAILGTGFGLVIPAMSSLIVNAVPAEQTGVASGMNANIRTIGGSIGAAAMASIVTARLQPSGQPVEAGYTIGFALLAAALLAAVVTAAAIPSSPSPGAAPSPNAAGRPLLAESFE